MTLHINLYGQRYEDDEPCFLTNEIGVRVWSRVRNRWLNWASLVAKAAEMGHTWQPREVGIPSIKWQMTNMFGQEWGPGLDDTNGLTSELVENGEVWTGATGGTPPTGWTADGLDPAFAVSNGVLHLGANAAGDHSITQTLTTVPGETYILEIKTGPNTRESTLVFDGHRIPLHGVANWAASFTASDTTVDVVFEITATGDLFLDTCRCYLESELTGNPGVMVAMAPMAAAAKADPMVGPYDLDGGKKFWINTETCQIGFDTTDDGTPDAWDTCQGVCDSSILDETKLAINTQLVANGCDKLPCVTKAGKFTAAYVAAQGVNDGGDE